VEIGAGKNLCPEFIHHYGNRKKLFLSPVIRELARKAFRKSDMRIIASANVDLRFKNERAPPHYLQIFFI
jgi:hypothetical protein